MVLTAMAVAPISNHILSLGRSDVALPTRRRSGVADTHSVIGQSATEAIRQTDRVDGCGEEPIIGGRGVRLSRIGPRLALSR